ncbi:MULTISPECIES: CD1107 family mobile element protein [unclassified Aerococcus]|nr:MULTISPECIES: DUF4366 domain-containing protein [unclassified Aerococcus]MDK6679202.1 DUF4366 domain-containing protein [Aerococcus sp. UMB8608]MDK6940761.1 DUF4366 domain-containing protein [Aerococcus sp. UMB8487]OFR32577.1 hypothetical protein HMPREF2892_08165 [Aerococcus sp. HMSC061A03]OFT40857.1 hypothetical protein HMPREF3161_04260 [Aerococcus sp. HMSC06H08]
MKGRQLCKRMFIPIIAVFLLSCLPLFTVQTNGEENLEDNQEATQTSEIVGDNDVKENDRPDYEKKAEEQLEGAEAMKVKENVDEDGKPFDPRLSFPDLKGKKQFLTFVTADNKTYHIVVTYETNSSNVRLLKEVNAEDLEEIAVGPQKPMAGQATSEDAKKEMSEVKEQSESEARKSDQKKSGANTLGIVAFVVVAVGGFAYWKKKRDKEDVDD